MGAAGSLRGLPLGVGGGVLAAVCVVVLGRSPPRKTSGASICTWISDGFGLGGGAVSDRAEVTFGCVPGETAMAGREALGSGGSIGSSEARMTGAAADDEGICTFGGRLV